MEDDVDLVRPRARPRAASNRPPAIHTKMRTIPSTMGAAITKLHAFPTQRKQLVPTSACPSLHDAQSFPQCPGAHVTPSSDGVHRRGRQSYRTVSSANLEGNQTFDPLGKTTSPAIQLTPRAGHCQHVDEPASENVPSRHGAQREVADDLFPAGHSRHLNSIPDAMRHSAGPPTS